MSVSLPSVCVVGAGHVGATTAHLLLLKRLAHVTLIDVVEGLAAGKALDLQQAAPIEGYDATVRGTTTLDALASARVVIITAGIARKPGMSRDELLATNAGIVGPIVERAAALAKDAVLVVVTNPLDLMVALALQRSGFPRQRVLGMAGTLDSARLRTFVALWLGVPPSTVEAMVLGSHGDLMVPVRSSVRVGGRPLSERLSADEIDQLFQRTRDGGAELVKLLKTGSAYYAPASGTVELAAAILRDTHATLPACAWLDGEYGLREVCIGVPVQLGAGGMERVVELPLTPDERAALAASAEQVRQGIHELGAATAKTR